jgi:hypothetical protein
LVGPLIAVTVLAGCGGPGAKPIGMTGAKVKGRLLDNGQPVKVRAGEDIVVSFSPPDPADVTSTRGAASINPKDGTFAFFGTSSAAGLLSAGKYKVTVSSIYGNDGVDRYAAAFGHDKTPLQVEVGSEPEQTFVVDIGRKTVTKQ